MECSECRPYLTTAFGSGSLVVEIAKTVERYADDMIIPGSIPSPEIFAGRHINMPYLPIHGIW